MIAERQTDDALLELAEVVLRDAGFTLLYGKTEVEEPLLLVENSDAVAAIGAFVTVADLVMAEGRVSRALSRYIAAAEASSKRWDGYTVLLTSSRASASHSEELSLLTQNLRHVRRIVRVAVDPTRAGLARALRPLLPVRSSNEAARIGDPLDAVTRMLERDGFAPDEVRSAIDGFLLTRTEGPLSEGPGTGADANGH